MTTRLDPAGEAALALGIGLRLRECRVRAGLTQYEAAEIVGCAGEVYGRYERGATMPSVPMIAALAAGLGVEPGVLFSGATPPPVAPPTAKRRVLLQVVDGLPTSGPVLALLRALQDAPVGAVGAVAALLVRMRRR